MRRVAFVVTGRVQGVGYRRFAVRAAEAASVSGFVRNEADGSVTGEAEGPDEALQAFLTSLQRGPALANVRAVEVADLPSLGQVGFDMR